ncbi:methylmalonyl-CoA mutase family protein [Hymenobacter caeli]|uniref:Methylmalonyl-CoA mutase n=1 Tax=Hymenobacter caeli TaxID=2735894 RepID=A0ABX2FRG4_9BACT|nr:methylmalonyl-CoA mutase family protein [Hymenobacter caeli]NRT19010.1 methylmalonyl-CoA mutase [Hymenobacter caeli]
MSELLPAQPVAFTEFPALTSAEWQARLARELKGQDPAALRWPLPDGLVLEPFYHREALDALGGPPAPLPFPARPWLNVPALPVPAGSDGHFEVERALTALAHGAEGVHFELAHAATFDADYLAGRLPLATTFIGYTVASGPDELLARLVAAAPGTALRGFLRFAPPLGPEGGEQVGYGAALRRCVALAQAWPDFRALAVNAAYFGNAGATDAQQLAYGLSTAAALLAELPDAATPLAAVAGALHWHVAVGPSYFPELAKLRALRRLWPTLLHAYGLPPAAALRVHAATATWTQTTLDPHTNLLRATTEAMSAVLGGADSLSVGTFDSLFAAPNEFSGRLARNLSLILKEETHLDAVQDPAAGSYFLETLTDELARAAWALFQHTEAAGGLPAARPQVLENVHTAATATFRRIAAGKQVVVGTNRFENRAERFPFNPKKLLRSAAFDTTRAAYPTEVLRLATALHFERRERKTRQAALVLLGVGVNRHIEESFWRLLPALERPELAASHPEGTLSFLFSSPEEATLMYATPEQFQRFARFLYRIPVERQLFMPPVLLSSDLATLQEAVRVFGFQEMRVQGYTTEEVLSRLQGR